MRTSVRLLALACALLPLPAVAIGTAFTYQGTLEDGGSLASGPYDLQFQLLDAGNAPVGAAVVVENVDVVDGVFTVQLDFAPRPSMATTGACASAYARARRWAPSRRSIRRPR